MNRHLAKQKKELDWAKLIYNNLNEEIRFLKDKIWKISYYSILIFVVIFAIINNTIDKDIPHFFFYFILTPMILTISISFKIITTSIVNIIKCRANLNRLIYRYKNINHLMIGDRYSEKEDFLGIYFAITIAFYFNLFYLSLYYKFNVKHFIFILAMYLFFEIPAIIARRKYEKDMISFDVIINILVIGGLIFLFIITNFDIVKNIIGRFLNLGI